MLNKRILPLAVAAFIAAALSTPNESHAALVPADFHWTGDKGWSVKTRFIFDDSLPIAGFANGGLTNEGISYMFVKVYNPLNQLVYSAKNIFNYHIRYGWWNWRFDTVNHDFQIGTTFDIGGDYGYFLGGDIRPNPDGSYDDFVLVNALTNDPYAVDRGRTYEFIVPSETVPDSASTSALAVLGIASLILIRRFLR